MDEKLMEQATFGQVCSILKNRREDSVLRQCIAPMAQLLTLVAPGVLFSSRDQLDWVGDMLGKGLDVLDTAEHCGSIIGQIKEALGKNEPDYVTQANNAFTAYVLIVYTAYFDAAQELIPQTGREIQFDGYAKWAITEKARAKIQAECHTMRPDYMDESLWIPGPAELEEDVDQSLLRFYGQMNKSLEAHLMGLADFDELHDGQKEQLRTMLQDLPQNALMRYRSLYTYLSAEFPAFGIWTRQAENRQLRDQIAHQEHQSAEAAKQILEAVAQIPEQIQSKKAAQILSKLDSRNRGQITKKLYDSFDMTQEREELTLPTRLASFIPQAFSSLSYTNKRSLEESSGWTEGQDLIGFINRAVHNQAASRAPLLILGGPGAGKTLLSQMLAGHYLRDTYHVILIRLRDLGNDSSLYEDIPRQIDLGLKKEGAWETLMEEKLQKPILLIFDGYDELLLASGRQQRIYLRYIQAFLDDTRFITQNVVHTIVTSRINLIDQAEIPDRTTVIRLDGFDDTRIRDWSAVWNENNRQYFQRTGLEPFEVPSNTNIAELAKQPLLLLMLALYDAGGNALRKEQDLQLTELYHRLFSRFIGREEKKKDAEFEESCRKADIDLEFERLGIAALGMYSRGRSHIRQDQLEQDLAFLNPPLQNSSGGLNDSERLLRRFLFIRCINSDAVQDRAYGAYEFLHNSFGEYLTAHYIVSRLAELPGRSQPGNQWYACMSYVPLQTRPNIVFMLRQWANVALKQSPDTWKTWLREELVRVLRGTIMPQIQAASGGFLPDGSKNDAPVNLMRHMAVYACNLMCIGALITDRMELSPLEQTVPGVWDKLLRLWQMGLGETEIFKLSLAFRIIGEEEPFFLYRNEYGDADVQCHRSTALDMIYTRLHMEPERSHTAVSHGGYFDADLRQSWDMLDARKLAGHIPMAQNRMLELFEWDSWNAASADAFAASLWAVFSYTEQRFFETSMPGVYLLLKQFADSDPARGMPLLEQLAPRMAKDLARIKSPVMHDLITDLLLRIPHDACMVNVLPILLNSYPAESDEPDLWKCNNLLKLAAHYINGYTASDLWSVLDKNLSRVVFGYVKAWRQQALYAGNAPQPEIIGNLLLLAPYIVPLPGERWRNLWEEIWELAAHHSITMESIYRTSPDIVELLCEVSVSELHSLTPFCLARLTELVTQCPGELTVKHFGMIRKTAEETKDSILRDALELICI